ncbi:F-box protein At4g09920 isoform X1 [Quercus suber]|uniref:F-box protein At4g09920 isoform X1 n=1 Tax=Quercus suber TaxID=58331 RepID=UPI000CE1B0FA|nr:F-box protein At4g09920-like isoform X1 [Quercus suber]POF16132.1 f-box/lrr-repeat protein 25 [Quercus suber]
MEMTLPPLPLPSDDKCNWNDEDSKDQISQLPDELIVSILSFMTLKEAVRTSVLSHRWKQLWPFFTGSLDFDDPDTFWAIADRKKKMKGERRKFVKRVNHVLKLHQGSNIDQFRVCFELDNHHKHHIDGWIDSAISKGVKRLELDFTPTEACEKQMLYTFPHERFISIKSSVVGVSCIKSLTSLTLIYVHVTGELLEHFLSNCPLLERLHVAYSEDLVTLKICSSSLRLKHLNIIRCWELKRIEIFAPNLESFGLVARAMEMHVNYAPRLLDVHVYVGAYDYLNYALCPLSSYLSQLQSLTLDFYIALISPHSQNMEFPKFQLLPKLKYLKWRVSTSDGMSLISFISMIEAAPFLQKFSLELLWDKSRRERELMKVMKYPNEHLKEVEITGFVGRAIDIELTVYLLESAIKLEKLVINPRSPALVGTPWEFVRVEENEGAIECAKQFKKNLPIGAELFIL